MAIFQGTKTEFNTFIGPRVRNVVNSLTIKARKELNGRCQKCNNIAELQSAHRHGKGRKEIITAVLADFNTDGMVVCDLNEVERKIIDAHYPISDTFLFLCSKCHREYDSSQKPAHGGRTKRNRRKSSESFVNDNDFIYLHRIKLWAGRPHQINHKIIRAYLSLEKRGPVLLQDLKAKCTNPEDKYFVRNFYSNFIQMTTDNGNPHGKVFYEKDEYVKVYPIVRTEINMWFGE